MFRSKARAELTLRILSGADELESINKDLRVVLDSSDFDDVPEFDEEEVLELMLINNRTVEVINIDNVIDIN